jgi:toxin FitB
MPKSSQRRAIDNYRTRLTERGMVRFEVIGRETDRQLVRSIARRLAEGGLRGAAEEGPHPRGAARFAAGRLRARSHTFTRGRAQGRPLMRYLLDTNIISHFTKPAPSPFLIAWMAEQSDDDLFIASFTLAEIRRGVLEKPAGRRRDQLEAWFSGPQGPQTLFAGRVLPFDERAGLIWARLMADGKASGRPRSSLDAIIAATAEANGCIVVTDNVQDFAGVETVNPLRG